MSETATYRDQIEAPRWAGVESFIRNECWIRDLELRIEVDKGWFRATIRFEVKGEPNAVLRFKAILGEALKDYNTRLIKADT